MGRRNVFKKDRECRSLDKAFAELAKREEPIADRESDVTGQKIWGATWKTQSEVADDEPN